jgi:uncharacterized repeat protein (TIGR01451 family)
MTYIFNVTNQGIGQGAALGVKVWFQIPEGTTFISASGPVAFTYSSNQITFDTVNTLARGTTLTFQVTVQAVSPGLVLGTAFLTANNYPQTIQVQEETTITGG